MIIVGVGASAGGLEAFSRLLESLPSRTGMAFVLVQHLAPTHESALPALLSGVTEMPVVQVTEGMRLKPDHVYVIPPNTQMGISARRLHLVPRPAGRSQHTPIDHFFHSLAEAEGSRAIGIILSGTASDGAAGLRDIKAAGGIAIAQDPATATYGGMPNAAVATGVVDLILPIREIAYHLEHLRRHPYIQLRRDGKEEESPVELKASDGQLGRIFALLRSGKGVDFSLYKPPTIKRRIQRRMALSKLDTIDGYIRRLKENPREVDALYQDILIQVTHFFREPQVLQAMVNEVFPQLLHDRPPDAPLRIWVPGCATGEEVYSVAILLMESMDVEHSGFPVQIFGTDVSEPAVDHARNGVYPKTISAHVTPDRLRRFFVEVEGGYRVNKKVRDLCVFARQDLTRDPPFSRLDVILCRNVLIYLGAPLQKRLMSVFHYGLKPSGFLVLGRAETVGPEMNLFSIVDKKHRIYSRREQNLIQTMPFSSDLMTRRIGLPAPRAAIAQRKYAEPTLLERANQYLLEHYTPAGVLVDSNLQIIQFRGQTGHYLEPASGTASLSLLKMAREGLMYGLRTALHSARKKGERVRKTGLRIRWNGGYRHVSLDVCPIDGPGKEKHFLIVFQETEPPGPGKAMKTGKPARASRDDGRVLRLRQELAASSEYLQSMIHDLEAANEELQSANEEILSSNEELQSTNEELDTAREELQSINEELNIVNEELHSRNDELNQVNTDLVNLLGSVQLAIVMVDAHMRIRRFTPMAEKLFNLIPGDIGRPLGNIQPTFEGVDLSGLINEVIDTMSTREMDVKDRQGHWFHLTVRPYKNAVNRVDGGVMVLFDIDQMIRQETKARFNEQVARTALETMTDPVLVVDADLRVRRANRAYCSRFEVSEQDISGRPLSETSDGFWKNSALNTGLARLLQHPEGKTEMNVLGSQEQKGLSAKVMARRVPGEDGRPAIVLVMTEERAGEDGRP